MCNYELHMGTFHFAVWSRSFSFAISAFISSISTFSFSSHSSRVWAYTFREMRLPVASLGENFPSQRWSLIM